MPDYYEPSVSQDLQAEENKLVNTALSNLQAPYISGLKLGEDVTIGNLTLNKIDSNGVVWVCTDIKGWWNLPDPEFPNLTRGWGDGSYDAVGRYASRLITLTGSFLTQDPAQAVVARKTLIEAIDLVYQGTLLVVDEDVSKSSFVRLSGRPEITSTKARGRHDFSIGLKAADPIKYEYLSNTYTSTTLTTGTASTIVNAGNTKTPIIFELTGTITGGVITNTYRPVGASADVVVTLGGITKSSNSYTTEIDTYNRAVVRVAGSPAVKTSARADIGTYVDWIQLYPGNNSIRFTATSGTSPVCKVNHRSGWIG